MSRSEIDVLRLIRIASALLSMCAIFSVAIAFEPQIALATQRLADDRDELRSDEVAFRGLPQLRRDRQRLAMRFEASEKGDAGARFLRALAGIARRRAVRVVSTSFERDVAPGAASAPDTNDPDARYFTSERLTVTVRGSYRATLLAISDVTAGAQIVRVDAPSLVRDTAGVTATVPVAILEPIGATP